MCLLYPVSKKPFQPDLPLFSSSHIFHSDQNIRFCDPGYTLCFATSLLVLSCFPDSEVSSLISSHLFLCYLILYVFMYVYTQMQIFVHKHTCIHIHSRYADKCLITGFLGGGESHFIVFSDFHDINIPPWSISWYQFDVTGLGVGEDIHILRSHWASGGCLQHRTIIHIYIYILEKAMATYSSTLAWQIPWREEPGRLQSLGSLRVGHD